MSEPNLGVGNGEIREQPPVIPEAAPAPEQLEAVPQPEAAPAPVEVPQRVAVEPAPGMTAETRVKASAVTPPPPVAKDDELVKVERILEDGMWEVYVSLPENARVAFKQKGEETAAAIRILIAKAHIRANRIHDLVHKWLGKIPGVNEFFLMQESKIKTDQFISLAAWVLRKGGIG
jgi:hypothetical protein